MVLSIIAALGENNELGKDNKLLWHLPADMAYFKNTTTGCPVIMGRKTFESIGRPLPNRRNVVITRDETYKAASIEVLHSLDEALELFKLYPLEVFVIGGGEIYKQALPRADKLYITRVHGEFEGDTFFPEIKKSIWQEVSRENHAPDEKNNFPYSFVIYKKR